MKSEQTAKKQEEFSLEEMDEVFARYLPEEELERVRKTVHQLSKDGGAAFWRLRDQLTGMYNQSGFLKILEEWKQECLQSDERLILICTDVDRLSNINLIYGRAEGDVAIRNFAQILEGVMSEEEIGCRLVSGEFIVAMRIRGEDTGRAIVFCHEVENALDNYNKISGKEYSLHAVHSLWDDRIDEKLQMQSALESALAQHHKHEENQKHAIGEGSEWDVNPAEHRLVQEVIDKNRFRYAYQPIIDARSGDIYGYEALMRTEEGIQLSPLTILRYAKIDNRLYDIEQATFFNVLGQKKSLGLKDRKLFINSIPGFQLNKEDYEKLRKRYSEEFTDLIVEITEQTEFKEEMSKVFLQRSREDGYGVAIDDYGTGYSNTASLLRFLPNCVKIDRLLITDIQENPKKQHFVNNIISFSHSNGILVLAEGVETAAEMKAVIQMGVDLIQGYYTAKPEFELMDEITKEIRDEIVSANISLHNNTQRKIYIASGERELSLMHLALEQYTGIVVSQPEITLVGNSEYLAGMSIKIKDECSCRVILRDAWLESVDDMPCIDIGNEAELTLVLEGSNKLEKAGIRVPDASVCRIEGTGDLDITAGGIHGFAIGNDYYSGVGTIICASSGRLGVSADGNQCICIGGGIFRQGEGVRILGGMVELCATGVEAIGIGCLEGSMPVEIRDCGLKVDFRVAKGIIIGCWKAEQNILVSGVKMEINGSGSQLCGMGSICESGGRIQIAMAEINIRLTGQRVGLIGTASGGLGIYAANSSVKLIGEGNNVLALGTNDRTAQLELRFVTLEVDLHAAEPVGIGAEQAACTFEGGVRKLWINEDRV